MRSVSRARGLRLPLLALAWAAAVHAAPGRAGAQEQAQDSTRRAELAARPVILDELVVTAARRVQRLADAPVAIELITRAEILHSGASDLSTALAERTGIQLSGGRPFGEGAMLQGFSSERVLVLVDGQPLGGRVAGTLDLSRIPIAAVERVEVVKGSQSALYGTDAMGGVINVITRQPRIGGWGADGELVTGTSGRIDAAGTLRGSLGRVGLIAEGGRRATHSAPGRADQTGAVSERWDGQARASWAPSSAWKVDAGVRGFDETQRWLTGQLFYFVDNTQRSGRLAATWTGGDARLGSTLYFTDFSHLFRRALTEAPAGPEGEAESQRLARAELLLNLDRGLDLSREARSSDRMEGHSRTLHTVDPYLQASWSRGPVHLVSGLRLAWSEQWGGALTPRVALMVRPVPALALRASAGRGYRAPNFEELYLEFLNVGPGFGYLVRGNPDLRAETSTTLSLGADWSSTRGFLRGQLFDNHFDDFIENHVRGDSSGVTVYTYGNVARGITRGAEFEAGFNWIGGRAEAGYGHVRTRDLGGEQPLLGRPGNSGRLSVQQALPLLGLRGSAAATYTGSTPIRHTEARTVSRDGFFRFDARLARSLPHGFEMSLGGRNLLDARPEEWPGYVGRHLYAGLAWRGEP
jgi:outer membrane receptor for ferrienterochelin and colicins